ncbi:cyanophycin synthetase [Noviherbaspirillum cavernae]|uniref:Cyanophycin synthetase n=1 Tax=Noviherbaspirillum cavernae TaxID=2320862 RepID=A0A418WWQ8_9BURK|nr:cyanophycin synthetase [Noviherbaspirillum cavernae]RJG04680.1 cyanophycin synthetase [Noviherbaspirillum cavernae]
MTNKTIEIINVLTPRGPNIWTYRPVIEAWVDIGDLEDAPSNTIPGFYERLTAMLPGLVEHHCGVGERGGFLQRLREGTWAAHIMEHVMIELQNLAGVQTGFGKARSTSRRGVYKLVVRARYEELSRAALTTSRDLVMAAIDKRAFDVDAAVRQLREIAESVALGPSTACIIDAATERRIPSLRLNDGNLVQLGYGARQRRIWTAETDQTSAIAESISSDKDLTKSLLQSCGVPVPEGRLVDSAADAWDAAEDIGIPVVVKPSDGNHGRGVSTDLKTRAEIEAAYALADAEGSEVIVERFIAGNEHRLLVVGGKMVAAARGESAYITGDGKSTIAELINIQLNSDPRRGAGEEFPLNLLLIDEADDPGVILLELSRQGYTTESVPPEGKRVLVQRHGNVAFDVTDLVHPSVAAAASLAARIVGLDIAGVDLVAEDISKPLDAQGGAIVEVNAGPGLLMHLKPADGPARPVGRAIVDHLFAGQDSGRIPIVGVTGSHGMTMVTRLVAQLLHLHGAYVGLANGDGLYLRQRQVVAADSANWASAHRVLMNRAVQAAVFENGYRAILTEGLAYDRCQVGVVTGIDPQGSLPDLYIDDAEQMEKVARTQVDIVLPEGTAVLNAADARVASLAPLCDGEVIFYSVSPDAAALAQHRVEGGRAVFVREGHIVLATGAQEVPLAALDVPGAIADADRRARITENILAAVGAGWALGIATDLIQAGIETFEHADVNAA